MEKTSAFIIIGTCGSVIHINLCEGIASNIEIDKKHLDSYY